MKNLNYTQALEFAVLDLAEQHFIMLKQIATHHDICPNYNTLYVPPSDMGKIKFIPPQPMGLVWITLFIVFAALFLFFIADKAGVI